MITLFHGDNTFASRKALQVYLDKKKAQPDYLDGQDLKDLDKIFKHTDSLAMFVEVEKIPVVKRFFQNSRKTLKDKLLEVLVKRPGLNIVFWEETKLTKNVKFSNFLKKHGEIQEFALLPGAQLVNWMIKEAKDLGFELDRNLAEKIIEKSGSDQNLLESELQKLGLFLKSEQRAKMELQDLAMVSLTEKEANIWELMDCLAAKNKSRTLEIMN